MPLALTDKNLRGCMLNQTMIEVYNVTCWDIYDEPESISEYKKAAVPYTHGVDVKGGGSRMINAEIVIKDIQYERSFENLFPMGIEKCKEMENPNLVVRFLLKMGDASMTAALGILNLTDKRSKNELLCGLANLYCREIQSTLNMLLQRDELGKNIQVGDIYMVSDYEGRLSFRGRNIQVDYGSLAKNDTVRQKIGDYASEIVKKSRFGGGELLQRIAAGGAGLAAGVAAEIAPQEVEKKVLSIMNRAENKSRLLKMTEQVLEDRGLCLKLEDFIFVQEDAQDIRDDVDRKSEKERKFELSPETEEGLLDAVVGYLKRKLEE